MSIDTFEENKYFRFYFVPTYLKINLEENSKSKHVFFWVNGIIWNLKNRIIECRINKVGKIN